MKRTCYFITGTGTSAGKTVLAALCVQHFRRLGVPVAGLKPVCSGGRADALALARAGDGALSLDEINPWHFRAPIAPVLAARKEKKEIQLSKVAAQVRALRSRFDVLVVEGAGGLLSPLGTGFDSRDLISALDARPIIVAPNHLGVINHLRLTMEALPPKLRRSAKIVLMKPAKPDAATASNAGLLAEFFDAKKIFLLPWLGKNFNPSKPVEKKHVRETLRRLLS